MNEETVKPGASDSNPASGSNANPVVTPNPSGTVTPNPNDAKFAELTEKISTLTRQYTASSEEAIRLKKENEKLATSLEERSNPQAKIVDTDDAFKQLVDEKGTVGALKEILRAEISAVVSKVDKLYDKEATSILESFKSKHPGMVSVADKFQTELTRMQRVYSDITEAMEAAYTLVGGREADSKVASDASATQTTQTLAEKSKQEKEAVIGQVAGGSNDRRTVPANPTAELESRIQALTDKAILFSVTGKTKQNLEIQAQIETLKGELRKQKQG